MCVGFANRRDAHAVMPHRRPAADRPFGAWFSDGAPRRRHDGGWRPPGAPQSERRALPRHGACATADVSQQEPPQAGRPPRLLDRVRETIRARGYSPRTAEAYCTWVRRFCVFHELRHPRELGPPEIEAFLSHLANEQHVSASTQNQALAAVLFLYTHVLSVPLDRLGDFTRAKRPQRVPAVLTPAEVTGGAEPDDRRAGADGVVALRRGAAAAGVRADAHEGRGFRAARARGPGWQGAEGPRDDAAATPDGPDPPPPNKPLLPTRGCAARTHAQQSGKSFGGRRHARVLRVVGERVAGHLAHAVRDAPPRVWRGSQSTGPDHDVYQPKWMAKATPRRQTKTTPVATGYKKSRQGWRKNHYGKGSKERPRYSQGGRRIVPLLDPSSPDNRQAESNFPG